MVFTFYLKSYYFIDFYEAMVSLTPLLFVVGVSMIKDIIEDHSRYKSDQEENDRVSNVNFLGQK